MLYILTYSENSSWHGCSLPELTGVIESLMGHKFGLDSAYLRLTEEEIGEMYLKAAQSLAILQSTEVTREDV